MPEDRSPLDPAQATRGQLLKRYRLLAGLTQDGLAERSGYSTDYISKLERGERQLAPAVMERMVDILGLGAEQRAALLAADVSPPAVDTGPRPLAGRVREMAEVRRHLSGLGPPVLLLAGEPGIGKTRLLEEAAALAAGSGWWVVSGGCRRRAQDPYAPFTDALAGALHRMPDTGREALLRAGGSLHLLLPELAGSNRPDGDELRAAETGAGGAQEQRLLFAEVARCLRLGAGPAGTLLTLDDLQWAGRDAFDLLAAIIAASESPPVRMIGAYRNSEAPAGSPLAEFLADLARVSAVQVLDLEPLAAAEAEQLLVAAFPDTDSERQALLPAIARRAGGVPFFLLSYLEDVLARGPGERRLQLPWTVAQVIRHRTMALADPAQDILGIASLVSGAVPVSLLSRVTGRAEDEVLDGLESAAEARLVEEDEAGDYRFRHDLIRETIERDLSASRRRLLHRRIGESLEDGAGAPAETLAFHFSQSDNEEKAINYLELAGDEAAHRVAHAAAADFYRQVVDLLERNGRAPAATWEKLGASLLRAARNDEAVTVLERAVEGFRESGNEEGLRRVTGRLADAHFRRGTGHEALDRVEGLLAPELLGEESASQGAIALREGLVRLLYGGGDFKRMLTLGRSLRRLGRVTGNGRLRVMGRRVEGTGLIFTGHLAEGIALIEPTISPDRDLSGDERLPEVGSTLSVAYLATGQLDRCLALSERMLRVAEARGDAPMIAVHTLYIGGSLQTRGEWQRAGPYLARAQELLATCGAPAVAIRMVAILAPCLIRRGDQEGARRYLDASLRAARSLHIAPAEHAALASLAELDLGEGRPADAVARLEPLLDQKLAWGYVAALLSTLAAAYLQQDELARARPLAERAVDEARRIGNWHQAVGALRVLGQVAARCGDEARAAEAFAEGLERARAMPFPYGEAQLLHAWGLMERERGDQAAAQEMIRQARAIFERLGAARDAEQLRALLN